MVDATNTNAPAPAPEKAKRPNVADSNWFKGEVEAESPLDDVTRIEFSLDALPGRKWTLDFTKAREAMLLAGLDSSYVNGIVAFSGFGYKTKLTNEASSVRNDPKIKGTDEANAEAQGAALDAFDADWQAGNWRAGRGEGESLPGTGDLAEAIFRFQKAKGKADADLESIKVNVGKADKDQRKLWRTNPDIAAYLATIKAERAQAKAGTVVEGAAKADDLLAV